MYSTTQSVGQLSGPLPLASGLVRRAIEGGDVFLVVEGSVCAANASWSDIWLKVGDLFHVDDFRMVPAQYRDFQVNATLLARPIDPVDRTYDGPVIFVHNTSE